MYTITFHIQNSHPVQFYFEDLATPLVSLLQTVLPDFLIEPTDIALDSNFKNIIIIDEKTSVADVFTASEKLCEFHLYLRPQLSPTVETRWGAKAPNSALTLEPKNQRQEVIEIFGTELIQLVGKQLGKELLETFTDMVRSYTAQTNLDDYFNTLVEFIQANTSDEPLWQQVESIITRSAEEIALIEELPAASCASITPESEDFYGIVTLAKRYIEDAIAAITLKQPPGERDDDNVRLAINKKKNKIVQVITERIARDFRNYYKIDQICFIVSETLNILITKPSAPTVSSSAAASAPPPSPPATNCSSFFRAISEAASKDRPNNPPPSTAPTCSGGMDDVV